MKHCNGNHKILSQILTLIRAFQMVKECISWPIWLIMMDLNLKTNCSFLDVSLSYVNLFHRLNNKFIIMKSMIHSN